MGLGTAVQVLGDIPYPRGVLAQTSFVFWSSGVLVTPKLKEDLDSRHLVAIGCASQWFVAVQRPTCLARLTQDAILVQRVPKFRHGPRPVWGLSQPWARGLAGRTLHPTVFPKW